MVRKWGCLRKHGFLSGLTRPLTSGPEERVSSKPSSPSPGPCLEVTFWTQVEVMVLGHVTPASQGEP